MRARLPRSDRTAEVGTLSALPSRGWPVRLSAWRTRSPLTCERTGKTALGREKTESSAPPRVLGTELTGPVPTPAFARVTVSGVGLLALDPHAQPRLLACAFPVPPSMRSSDWVIALALFGSDTAGRHHSGSRSRLCRCRVVGRGAARHVAALDQAGQDRRAEPSLAPLQSLLQITAYTGRRRPRACLVVPTGALPRGHASRRPRRSQASWAAARRGS